MAGRLIYQSSTGAQVYQNVLYRWLTLSSKPIQTLINRRHPDKLELEYIHQLTFSVRTKPASCCLLGLGGAGVAHTLASTLGDLPIIAVENNADIIEIAKRYFMIDRLTNLSIIHQDASLFVKQCTTSYQHLMIDITDPNTFPSQCNTDDFFSNCRRILSPNGILAINLYNLNEQWSVFQRIRENFNLQTVSLPVKGTANMVVLACNSPSINPLLDLLNSSHCLKKLTWDMKWGCIAQL